MNKTPGITVYHFLTAPIRTDNETELSAERWTGDYVARGRHYFADNGTELRCVHPLFSQVVAFGCASLVLRDHEFSLERMRIMVGDERQCLLLARQAYAEVGNYLLFYSAWGWMPKYLMARSTAMNVGDGSPTPPLLGRMLDLADMLSLGGLVGAPPLHLALAGQDIARIPRPLPTVAIERLMADAIHEPICREIAYALWGVSALYARMHFGSAFTLAPFGFPSSGKATGDATIGEGN